MATSAISGKSGTLSGATGASEVREWTVTVTGEPLDATSFDSAGWREFVLGLKGATGSFVCIGAKPVVEDGVTLTLETDGGATPKATIEASAIINSVEYATPVDGLVAYSVDFTMSGEVEVT